MEYMRRWSENNIAPPQLMTTSAQPGPTAAAAIAGFPGVDRGVAREGKAFPLFARLRARPGAACSAGRVR
jgi:hypothetical protein